MSVIHYHDVASGRQSWGHCLLDNFIGTYGSFIPLNKNSFNIATESSNYQILHAQRHEIEKLIKLSKLFYSPTYSEDFSFSPYVCSFLLGMRLESIFRKIALFFWIELSLIGLKSNFPHHDNCTNVWCKCWRRKGGVGVDKGWKTPWRQWWSREVNPAV